MSCPYFYPTESRGGSALLPLGGSWSGQCHADSAAPAQMENELWCNLGYARGQCSRFPDGDGPDAVRFTITRHDAAGLLLYHVVERDHHPFAHGPIEDPVGLANPLLARQAAAYAESYRRRKQEA